MRYEMLVGRIDERQIREFAGMEAKVFGRGGLRAVARATGLAVNTVRRGIADLEEPPSLESASRVRKAGAGRKKLRDKDAGLVEALEELVEPFTRGDPMRPLRWTCKSVRRLAGELQSQGHAIIAGNEG